MGGPLCSIRNKNKVSQKRIMNMPSALFILVKRTYSGQPLLVDYWELFGLYYSIGWEYGYIHTHEEEARKL